MKLYNNQRNAHVFFFIYFLICFCLTCFRLSLSPPSSVLVQFQPGPDADTIPRRLELLPNLYTVPLEGVLKESPKHVRQKQIRK
jgi:hypothetical protein